jgi:GT2 family glycosyltransferase
MPKVYILILNYLQWQDTIECLKSVLNSEYKNFSVVVIENNSPNNSSEVLKKWICEISTRENFSIFFLKNSELNKFAGTASDSKIIFVQNEINNGFAAGNNIALRFLMDKDAYVWLLNPDMTVGKNTLSQFVNHVLKQPTETISGGIIRSEEEKEKILFCGGGKINFLFGTVKMIKNLQQSVKPDYISGSCLFTHASNFKKIGLLPEDYFLYWEETDWCYRAIQNGFQLQVCETNHCYDKISTAIGKSFLAEYYYTRNGLLFISRFRKKNVYIVLFFIGFRFLKRVFTGRWDRARGVYKGVGDFFKSHFYEIK